VRYFPTFILIVESVLSFYKYFYPRSFFGPNILDIILGLVFLVLAFFVYKNNQNRVSQWVVIILSLFLGPGGFIGFGAIAALLLAISFIVVSKKSKSTTN